MNTSIKPDYRFCNRMVTVYSAVEDCAAGSFAVRRCVLPRCYLQAGQKFTCGSAYGGSGRVGDAGASGFTLLVPLDENGFALGSEWRYLPPVAFAALEDKAGYFTLGRGVKVFDGVGPVVDTAEGFARFIPALCDGVHLLETAAEHHGPRGALLHVTGGA